MDQRTQPTPTDSPARSEAEPALPLAIAIVDPDGTWPAAAPALSELTAPHDLVTTHDRAGLAAAFAHATLDAVIACEEAGFCIATALKAEIAFDTEIIFVGNVPDTTVADLMQRGAKDVITPERLAWLAPAVYREATGTRRHRVCESIIAEGRRDKTDLVWQQSILSTLMEAWPDMVYVKDRQSRFIVANPTTACILHAKSTEDMVGKSDHDFFPEHMADDFRESEQQLMESGVSVIGREEFVQTDAGAGWFSSTKLPFRIDGKVAGLVGVNRDMTEIKEHRDHLEDLVAQRTRALEEDKAKLERALLKERELVQLQRQFVSMVSHEFRTPLAIIDAKARSLQRKLKKADLSDAFADPLESVRTAVRRLTDLMESTLTSARIEAGTIEIKHQDCDLQTIVGEIIASQALVDKGRDIVVDASPEPLPLWGDPGLLGQVVTNLLSNALKYSNDRVDLATYREGDYAVLSVRDRGVGIPEDELPKLFERFFRARTSDGIPGTGIGLHLVKYLVEGHDGTITAASDTNGSTFTVRLPLKPAET